jgi:hypothetical protein
MGGNMNRLKAWFSTWSIPDFKKFTYEQRQEVYSGLIDFNLTLEQVLVYAQEDIEPEMMSKVKFWLSKGITKEDLRICIKEMDVSIYRLNIVCEGIKCGFTGEEIMTYLDPKISDEDAFKKYSHLVVFKFGKKVKK